MPNEGAWAQIVIKKQTPSRSTPEKCFQPRSTGSHDAKCN